ncbi:hypothetical protein G7062_08505 [Erysipelothrix sp. HDW6C]|uniref:hypothetical protein n=1 Tax=Erysipelothrix sp. HDW6C TaxID=2714930 RepID=UPI00140834DD|nr:hypothetical protein [Erysipelothrix sp. HDW6C]QIK70333.1 hypothetical protein G7062_08505 [Erysipelothrix sp. HDW6C]
MRKFIAIALVSLLILTGCGSQKTYDQMIQQALSRPLVTSPNRNKQFLKYYVLPDTGIKETTQLSTLMEVAGYPVMMTLNVSDIITRKYYDASGSAEKNHTFVSQITEDQTVFSHKGTYLDRNDQEQNFIFSVLEAEGEKILVLENGLISLIAVVRDVDVNYVVDSMFVTMRSSEVNEDKVVAHYSNKEIIDYKAIHEEFFDHKVPETGTLLDIYNQLHPDDKIVVPNKGGDQ